MEEEKRLFYVAITRAKEKLFMTYAKQRASFSGYLNETKPSRFLKNIKDSVKILADKNIVKKSKKSSKPAASYGNKAFSSSSDIRIGQLVKHDVFGKGVVKSISGNKATVIFENVGEKQIMKDFLKPA